MFNTCFFGVGTLIGALVAAYATHIGKPQLAFGFASFVAVLITVFGYFTDPELESNEYANVKDLLYVNYEKEFI